MPVPQYAAVTFAGQPDLDRIAQVMLILMSRNVSSDGYKFTDPFNPGQFSAPGCIIASPSYDKTSDNVTQDYVYNWTRDSAMVATELAAAGLISLPGTGSGPLDDYVSFAASCQAESVNYASFTVEGTMRPGWTYQNDGPALRILTILSIFGQLSPAAQTIALAVARTDLDFLLSAPAGQLPMYQQPTRNLWEEVDGLSLFALSAIKQALLQVQVNTVGLKPSSGDMTELATAIDWVNAQLPRFGTAAGYLSIIDSQNLRDGYDPNIDVVLSCIYGALSVGDPLVLATAGALRGHWADPNYPGGKPYPINLVDAKDGRGPMLGRYPGDVYDGNFNAPADGHPWAIATTGMAQFYYRLAATIKNSGTVPSVNDTTRVFFSQVGIDNAASPAAAVTALVAAGDAMLQAVIYHSDRLELSEQFNADTGYESSVKNLTWSYASFLSAVRERAAAVP